MREAAIVTFIPTVTGELRIKRLAAIMEKTIWNRNFFKTRVWLFRGKETQKDASAAIDYRKDPIAIFRYKSSLRLVVNLQDNVKAIQNEAYARKVKISNLQQMAETLVYVQEHGYGHREEVVAALEQSQKDLETSESQAEVFSSQMKTLNAQIHYTGQYYASKNTYRDYLKAINKKKFRLTHEAKIQQYLEARDWLKEFYPNGKMLSLKALQEAKESLKAETRSLKEKIQQERTSARELETVLHNIDAILNREEMFIHQYPERSQEHTKNNYTQKQKEETL